MSSLTRHRRDDVTQCADLMFCRQLDIRKKSFVMLSRQYALGCATYRTEGAGVGGGWPR